MNLGRGVHDGGNMPFVLVSFPINSHCYGDDCLGRGVFCFAFVHIAFVSGCPAWLTGS